MQHDQLVDDVTRCTAFLETPEGRQGNTSHDVQAGMTRLRVLLTELLDSSMPLCMKKSLNTTATAAIAKGELFLQTRL